MTTREEALREALEVIHDRAESRFGAKADTEADSQALYFIREDAARALATPDAPARQLGFVDSDPNRPVAE